MKITITLANCHRKDGKKQIYINVSHQYKRKKIPTGFFINPSDWDDKTQRVAKKATDSQTINNFLFDKIARFEKTERELNATGIYYSVGDIVADKSNKGNFVEYCRNEVNRRKDLGQIQYSQENCYWNVIDILVKFGGAVIPFSKITLKFIKDLHDFVVREKNDCSPTTHRKYQNHLRTFFNCAIDDRLIDSVNWRRVSLAKAQPKEIESLTSAQLKQMESNPIINPHINYVRELFLFGCYTGCAFVDIMSLTDKNIVRDGDKVWLKYYRTKNQQLAKVPLHSDYCAKALPLIEKYGNTKKGTIFPTISNQEANRTLKIIQEIYKFDTIAKLGTHVARHTFITLLLQFGIDIYNVKICAGHATIATTQKYVYEASIDMDKNFAEADFDL